MRWLSGVSQASFPIHKLPYLAQAEILKCLDPLELIDISLLSQRNRVIVKATTKFSKAQVDVQFCVDFSVIIRIGENRYFFHADVNRKNNQLLDQYRSSKQLERTELRFVSIKLWAEYILDLFNTDIYYLLVHTGVCEGRMSSILSWIQKRQLVIPECQVLDTIEEEDGAEEIIYFLENCNVKNKLHITITGDNENEKKLKGKFAMDELYITQYDGHVMSWITVDMIMTFNCVHIELGKVTLNASDVNEILKSWISGNSLRRMKFFSAVTEPLEYETLTNGIEINEREETLTREFQHHSNPSKYVKITGGTDILNDEGFLGTFDQREIWWYFPLLEKFLMVVWNE